MKILRIITLLLVGCLNCRAVFSADKPFQFAGVYAYGVTPEAITADDLVLICLMDPAYIDDSGQSFLYKLDLPFFRQSGKFRYRVLDVGYRQTFDAVNNVLTWIPTSHYDGNPYYAPRVSFSLVKSITASGFTYIRYRDIKSFTYMLQSHDEKYGNRGAMIKCPFKLQSYKELAVDDKSLPALSESEALENANVLYNLKPNPDLVKKIVAAKEQLQ